MRRAGLVAAVVVAACASAPRPRLDASGLLVSPLPSEARLTFEEYQVTNQGRMLSISLRVAHSASRSLEAMRLLSCEGKVIVGEGTSRHAFAIVPYGGKRLPGRLLLTWLGKRHDGTDKQPAYYEYTFEPASIEGISVTAVDYQLTAVIEMDGRPVAVRGRGRALPGQWQGSAPPPEPGTATRF